MKFLIQHSRYFVTFMHPNDSTDSGKTNSFALDAESMSASIYDKTRAVAVARFVDFMTRMAFEQVLPHKSVAEASDSRKTRHDYRKNAIISSHCLKLRY